MGWVLLVLFFIIIEIYSYQALLMLTSSKGVKASYFLITLLVLVFIVFGFMQFDRALGQNQYSMMAAGLILIFYLPKLIVTVILLVEDLIRVIRGCFKNFISKRGKETPFLPERRKFITLTALGIAAIPFFSVIHGITIGRFKFRVIKQSLLFDDLPEAFDGFTVMQISDIHCGSFDNKEKIEYAINLINEQKADVFLFTGDLVNSLANEMDPWLDSFKKIRSFEYGKYSVLGNHDYGEYVNWDSETAKEKNFAEIKKLHDKLDFNLLLNDSVWLEKDGQRIAYT